jgi:hypothetical protein
MNRLILILFFVLLSLLAVSAFASLEIRGSYDYAMISPSDANTLNQLSFSPNYPSFNNMTGFGADVTYYLPMNLGLGVRYESWASKVSGTCTMGIGSSIQGLI